jgi:ubiquinol-cytochrome c reductase cytochrome b subunit
MGQMATTYYFGYFLVVLPLLSIFERALPVPLSISRPVLGAGGSHAAIAQSPKPMEKL